MTAHDLARKLLSGPDVPVTVTDDYGTFEVSEIVQSNRSFNGENDTTDTPRHPHGGAIDRDCIEFIPCGEIPPSPQEIAEQEARKARIEAARLSLTPGAFALRFATITPLTPDALEKMANVEENLTQHFPMETSSPSVQKSNVAPLADRVLVENIPPYVPPDLTGDTNLGGIFVKADSIVAKKAAAKDSDIRVDGYVVTRVIATGPNCWSVKAGDRIVIARHHAFSLMPPGVEESTFVKESDVIAILK